MPKLPECDRCLLYARNPHLVCAVHLSGVEGDRCMDFRLDLTVEPEELWNPVGSSYYNGELIVQPAQIWSQLQQLELLDWHPLFTGRCPECERAIVQVVPHQVHWDCAACGWMDDSI